jgi:hypothetical protein
MAKSATAAPTTRSHSADNASAAIALGSQVSVEVDRQPTNEAAVKTIMRILGKDRVVATEQRRLEKVRVSNYNPKRRGGRLYAGRLVKQFPVKAEIGDRGTVHATIDVLRDLDSVRRFVAVKPA